MPFPTRTSSALSRTPIGLLAGGGFRVDVRMPLEKHSLRLLGGANIEDMASVQDVARLLRLLRRHVAIKHDANQMAAPQFVQHRDFMQLFSVQRSLELDAKYLAERPTSERTGSAADIEDRIQRTTQPRVI